MTICYPGQMARLPLVAQLGQAHDAFEREFDRRLARSEFSGLSLAHSRNVLRHLGRPMRASAIVGRCGLTKQAVSQQLAHLERHGYVQVSPDPGDHRARLVSLTERGRAAQRTVVRTFAEIERDWAGLVGPDRLGDVRATLDMLLATVDGPC